MCCRQLPSAGDFLLYMDSEEMSWYSHDLFMGFVLYLCIYIVLLAVPTNQKRFQCKRPKAKRASSLERTKRGTWLTRVYFHEDIDKHCSLANLILVHSLPHTYLPVSTSNTIHHSHLSACLTLWIFLTPCLDFVLVKRL